MTTKRSASKTGVNNPAAKLTADQVAAIRRYAKRGPHPWGWRSKMAREHGVSPGTITDILAGRIWAEKKNRKNILIESRRVSYRRAKA